MTLNQLRYFVTVAEALHFGRAAAKLRISQPALSRQISQLERDLKVKLLVRTKRKVVVTDSGNAFFSRALETIRQADKSVLVAQRAERGESGKIRISTVGSLPFSRMLPSLLNEFRTLYPDVELYLKEARTKEQLQKIQEEETDVGFARLPIRTPADGLTIQPIFTEEIHVALRKDHALASRKMIKLKDLANERFVMYPYEIGGLHDWAMKACNSAGFDPYITQEASSVPIATTLAAAGLGIALVPQCAKNMHTPGVVYKTLSATQASTEIALIYRSQDRSKVIRNFVQMCLKRAEIQ